MKRITLLLLITVSLVISACGTAPAEQDASAEKEPAQNQAAAPEEQEATSEEVSGASEWVSQEADAEEIKTSGEGIVLDNVFVYNHVNGEAKETDRLAYVLFEYETLNFIKYQVAYLACT